MYTQCWFYFRFIKCILFSSAARYFMLKGKKATQPAHVLSCKHSALYWEIQQLPASSTHVPFSSENTNLQSSLLCMFLLFADHKAAQLQLQTPPFLMSTNMIRRDRCWIIYTNQAPSSFHNLFEDFGKSRATETWKYVHEHISFPLSIFMLSSLDCTYSWYLIASVIWMLTE